MFGVLESIAEQKVQKRNKKNKNSKQRLIVQTVENDPILRRFLEMELFPSIPFQQQVGLFRFVLIRIATSKSL